MPNSDYGYMFEIVTAFKPERKDLEKLAPLMSGKLHFPDAEKNVDKTLSLTEDLSVKIPAGYTYLAQFIAHDITFDSKSDRHIRQDFPDDIIDPQSLKNLKNLRNLTFDLETIYGFEEPKDGSEIPRTDLLLPKTQLPMFMLGETHGSDRDNASNSYPNDLPRKPSCVEASIY